MKNCALLVPAVLLLGVDRLYGFVPLHHHGTVNRLSTNSALQPCGERMKNAGWILSSALQETDINADSFDFDDDDDDVYSGRTYEEFYKDFDALANQKTSGIAQQAEALFDEMLEAYLATDDAGFWPNATVYNKIIGMHAWSFAEDGADKAEHYLNRMEDASVELVARPNLKTYLNVMDAWTNRDNPDKVKEILLRAETRYQQTQDDAVKPNRLMYNRLIKAWMKSGREDAAQQAESILQFLTNEYEKGNEELMPDSKSFIQVMRCFRNRQDETSVDKVTSLLQQMSRLYRISGEEAMEPNIQVHNEYIATIGENPFVENNSQQAEQYLYQLMEEGRENEMLRPNFVTFRHVIYSYRMRGNNNNKKQLQKGLAFKIEKLLELQKALLGRIDNRNYEAALQVISKSYDPKKVPVCERLLQQMKEGGPALDPSQASYNALLNACAHPMTRDNAKRTMAIAVEALNELRENVFGGANFISYAYFLKCCSRLLPRDKSDALVRNVFGKCCQDGQVAKFVLMEFLEAASEELAADVLGGDPQEGVKIPRRWSRNVRDKRQLLG